MLINILGKYRNDGFSDSRDSYSANIYDREGRKNLCSDFLFFVFYMNSRHFVLRGEAHQPLRFVLPLH